MIPQTNPSNAPEWSVSELAGALKRTLEDAFGYVRLRARFPATAGRTAPATPISGSRTRAPASTR